MRETIVIVTAQKIDEFIYHYLSRILPFYLFFLGCYTLHLLHLSISGFAIETLPLAHQNAATQHAPVVATHQAARFSMFGGNAHHTWEVHVKS